MQTVLSEIAFTFVDDAIVLATGFGRFTAELASDLGVAARRRIMAPIDRLARACDVAGILPARNQSKTKTKIETKTKTRAPRRGGRFDVLGMRATFRNLRDLT
jgi:hypothetical protein